MAERPTLDPDTRSVSESAAARLLARASELEAAGGAGFTIAQLRAAALEAGISPQAFERAVAELEETRPRRRRSRGWAVAAAAVVVLATAVFLARLSPAPTPGSTVEEAITLQCLSAGDAADLVRPYLQDQQSTVRFNETRAPHVLIIRTTPPQLERVKNLLAEQDAARGCTVPAAPGAVS